MGSKGLGPNKSSQQKKVVCKDMDPPVLASVPVAKAKAKDLLEFPSPSTANMVLITTWLWMDPTCAVTRESFGSNSSTNGLSPHPRTV